MRNISSKILFFFSIFLAHVRGLVLKVDVTVRDGMVQELIHSLEGKMEKLSPHLELHMRVKCDSAHEGLWPFQSAFTRIYEFIVYKNRVEGTLLNVFFDKSIISRYKNGFVLWGSDFLYETGAVDLAPRCVGSYILSNNHYPELKTFLQTITQSTLVIPPFCSKL